MGIVNNDKVSFGSPYDYDDAVREIGGLLGVGPREDGMYYLSDICTADSVNPWAKNKPINWSGSSNLDESQIDLQNYGLKQDTNFYYKWVKPTSYKRIKDFNGYNHKAVPPLANSEHLGGTKVFFGADTIVLDPSSMLEKSENVEIPIEALGFNYEQGYVGFLFINRSNKKGWVHSTNYQLKDVIENNDNLYITEYNFNSAPNVSDGDTIDVYYCLTPTPGWGWASYNNNVEVVCCDATHGHAVIYARKIDLQQISVSTPTIYKSYNGYDCTFSGCGFEVSCSFPFGEFNLEGAGESMCFELYINDNLCGEKTLTINSPLKNVTITSGSVVVDADTLKDDSNTVKVEIKGYVTLNPNSKKSFFNKRYNITSGSFN